MEQDSVNTTISYEAKRIDRFIHRVAHFKHITPVLFVVAYLEAIISPILPELVVAAVLSYRKNISWKFLSVVSALGSVCGAATLYVLGKLLYARHTEFFEILLGSRLGLYGEKLLEHNTFVSVFLAAFTPLPDRVFAFLSGLFSLSFVVVVIAFFLGRLIRVGIVAYFSYEYGDEARKYIMKHTKVVTLAILVLVGVYVAYKFMC